MCPSWIRDMLRSARSILSSGFKRDGMEMGYCGNFFFRFDMGNHVVIASKVSDVGSIVLYIML